MPNIKRFFHQRITYVCFLCMLGIAIVGCYSRGNDIIANDKIMVAGSTSVQPIAEKLAEHYMQKLWDVVSTSKKNGEFVKIEVQGGGSSAGIQAVRSRIAHIGTSSRELKKEEKDLVATIIAYDALVVIVHPSNPIQSMSLEQISSIFSYNAQNWEELTYEKQGPITMVTREEGSGTRGAFEELVMHKREISERCLVQDSTGAVREIVSADPNAIGYMSFGALNTQVKCIAIGGIPPKMENFITTNKDKKYSLIRPFLFVTSKEPDGPILKFIQYIRSSEGAILLKQEGLIPHY